MLACFRDLLSARAAGQTRGLYSVCSANALVLGAAVRRAAHTDMPLLVEATANQVNQEGGYTGLRPADFAARLEALQVHYGVAPGRVVFGGDHLGPYPWRKLGAEEALSRAEELVRGFVLAGAQKIHLDASMPLGGDRESGSAGAGGLPLEPRVAAERAARLCLVAENAYRELRTTQPGAEAPVYVIGTEVPVPGGARPASPEKSGIPEPVPTRPEDFRAAVELHREAFGKNRLAEAWARVVAVVVQPGLEFDAEQVHVYRREAARELIRARSIYPGLLFEGHSTDFQPDEALLALVEDGVCILKVGPALSFALREALFALDAIAGELGVRYGASLADVVERSMRDDPSYWKGYYLPDSALPFQLKFSYSDRIRYYWDRPEVSVAVDRLFDSLRGRAIPPQLFSQYLPRFGSVHGFAPAIGDPEGIAMAAVEAELARYEAACRPRKPISAAASAAG